MVISEGLANLHLPLPSGRFNDHTSKLIKSPEPMEPAPISDVPCSQPAEEQATPMPTARARQSYIAPGLANIKLPLTRTRGSSQAQPAEQVKPEEAVEEADPELSGPVELYDLVECVFGRGKVVEIRDTGVHVVKALGWGMARGARPTYYMQAGSLKKVRARELHDMATTEKLQMAADHKDLGGACFKQQDVHQSLWHYQQCRVHLEGARGELSNEERAWLFEMMVPCHNNMALCHMQLKEYQDATVSGGNAHRLCAALEGAGGKGVMRELRKRGVSEHKVFKQWKSKGLYLAARGHTMRGEHTEAIALLDQALSLVKGDRRLAKDETEIKKLLTVATKHAQKQQRQEQKMWAAAFNKNSTEPEAVPEPEPVKPVQNGAHQSKSLSMEQSIKAKVDAAMKTAGAVKPKAVQAAKRLEDSAAAVRARAGKEHTLSIETEDQEDMQLEEAEEVSWLAQHKVAVGVTAVAVLALAGLVLTRSKQKSRA